MKIKLLDPDIINKIAAGEVIERPASIVKECLENAIDANATKIEIILKKSGKKEIIIKDNGTGIAKEDLPLSLKKHATSKISTSDDLFKIHTLGFRGEALASISSISKLKIQSKTTASDLGYEIDATTNQLNKLAMPTGTNIIVQDIFYNTPARLRYLKSDYIELSHIVEIVEKYALCYPNKYFKLLNDDKTLIQSSTQSEELTNISSIINKPFTEHLIPINETTIIQENEISLKGFISKPGYLPKNSNYIIFYLNNRYIKNRLLQDALVDGFKTMLFLEEKPAAIIHLDMNSEFFDVNIHPRKLDVKFTQEQEIYQFVVSSIKDAIEKYNQEKRKQIQNEISLSQKKLVENLETNEIAQPKKEISAHHLYSVKQKNNDTTSQETLEDSTITKNINIYESKTTYSKKYNILDIIDNTYIILKAIDSLYIVDQHALHERVLFENLLDEFKTRNNSQNLITPLIIDLSNSSLSKLENISSQLKSTGFDFDYFGNNSVRLNKIPASLIDILDKKTFFKNLIDNLNINDIKDDANYKIATKACKSAIKAHDELTQPQIEKLLDYMFETNIMLTCPHGRPFFIELNKKELEKKFKRV